MIKKANSEIKMIQFKCRRTVTNELERDSLLQGPSFGDGGKGPVKNVEILENCDVIFKIEVKGRRAPLKLHLNYDANQAEMIRL